MDEALTSIPNYHLMEKLHEGSRTLVYRGRSLVNGQQVVIKLLKSEYPSFKELVQFRNQYAIAQHLDTPGIVQPLRLEPYQNSYALIMADEGYISLWRWMEENATLCPAPSPHNRPLPVRQVLAIASQLANTLDGLYQNRVIHKDIKPANILIHPTTHNIKLADFSISSLLPKEQQMIQNPAVLEGTLAYIAPEQTGRMNRGIDYRTDFYSLGVTLYELLTGCLPFSASDPMEIVHCHIAQSPPPFERISSPQNGVDQELQTLEDGATDAIPQAVQRIVLKLMAKNAEDRYQSALGLKYDLDYCLAQLNTTGTIPCFELGQYDQGDRFLIPEILYGREQEVAALLAAFDRVAGCAPSTQAEGELLEEDELLESQPERNPERKLEGKSELMLVAGYSGVGKTAVINEVHKPIARQRGYFIRGKFDQFQRNIPFSAFVQAFRELMGQLLAESDTQLAQWKNRILDALGTNGQVMIDVIPELAAIIGSQPPVPELPEGARQNRFNRLFLQFIQVFTQPDHPLVLFLDDLQWADAASLQLMVLMIGSDTTKYLLMLGAYRDNEVSPGHPFMLSVEEIDKLGGIIHVLTLKPLKITDLRQLIADTLRCSPKQAIPLTELVYRKTQGNPFFATQFLKGLYNEGLIVWHSSPPLQSPNSNSQMLPFTSASIPQGGWQCDIGRVRELALTDNVVEFMARQLQLLPESTQYILKLAACIGNQFDLDTLAMVCERSPAQIADDLWGALRKEVIVPINETYKFYQSSLISPVDHHAAANSSPNQYSDSQAPAIQYKFLHDRVQQAAYSLIAETEKQRTHFTIGKLLLQAIPDHQRQIRIFEVVNQLNFGADLVDSVPERIKYSRLNTIAGQKAKQSTAYEGAISYYLMALRLLGDRPWQENYRLTLSLHDELASTYFVSGQFDEMEHRLDAIFHHAQTLLDQVTAHEIQIQSYLVRGQLKRTIETAIQVAQLLGTQLPKTADEVSDLVATTKETLTQSGHLPRGLINLPTITDQQIEATVRILSSANSAAYVGHPEYLPAIVSKQASLLFDYGNTPLSAFVYAWYGTFLCQTSTQVEQGHEFGELALALLETFPSVSIKAKTQFMVHCMIFHWKHHARETLTPLLEAYQYGRDNGDIEYASWAILVRCEHFFCIGHPLMELERELQVSEEAIQKCQQASALIHNQVFHQATLNLLGQAAVPYHLDGEKFNGETLAALRQNAIERTGVFHAYLCELILCYLLEEFELALENANAAIQYQRSAAALLAIATFYLYDSLARLARYPHASEVEQAQLMEQVVSNQQHLEHWATYAPANHRHKHELVNAERDRLLGNCVQAIESYDQAIANAKENGYLHEEALANELAAKFYLNWDKLTIAQAYMQAAYYGYARWGAKAKIDQLEQRYPQLLSPILEPPDMGFSSLDPLVTRTQTSTTYYPGKTVSQESGRMSDVLDFASVLKSTQALSRTIELNELLHQLAHITLENSGAETCILILPSQTSEWEIRAIAQVTDPQTNSPDIETVLAQPQPMTITDMLPIPLINYVKHTGESVMMAEMETNIPGIMDDYLWTHQPQSVLCQPLMNQGNLIGVLYLENRATRDVFTRDRLRVVHVLCTQAAIALENARLIQQLKDHAHTLEQRVRDRTLELEKAKESADRANQAKSDFLSSMSHELRTPLNSIIGFTQLLSRDASIQPEPLERINIINRSGEHLLTLINNILEMSKVEAGQTTLNNTDTDVHQVVQDVQDMFRLKTKRKGVELRLEGDRLPHYISLDEGKLRQILINLIGNAVKFTQSGSITTTVTINPDGQRTKTDTISIPTSNDQDSSSPTLDICICDTGPGIAAHELDQLFAAFEQTTSGRQSRQGTGLGLAISKKFVHLMDGEITVESTVGIGTTFHIVLPLIISDALVETYRSQHQTALGLVPGQPCYRLLVVDDEPDNRQVLSELLRMVGLDVKLATDGQECLDIWQQWRPHLIWMDLRMPKMGGIEATRKIREMEATRPSLSVTQIIAITASVFNENREEILSYGFNDYVVKPFKESVIWDTLTQSLGLEFVYADHELDQSDESSIAILRPDSVSETLHRLMPVEWLQEMHEFASRLKRKRVLRLLEQLPEDQIAIAQYIKDLAEEYEFAEIAAIAQGPEN